MKSLFRIVLVSLIFGFVTAGFATQGAPGVAAAVTDPGWQAVAPGIDYQEFHLDDPNRAYVARMERSNSSDIIDTAIARGSLASGVETVRNMAARSEDTINYWDGTWTTRSHVVVAINGSYYNETTGVPQSGMITSGWYAKRFDNLTGGSGFAWRMDRTPFIGECVTHRPEKQTITFYDDNGNATAVLPFDGINVSRSDNTLVMYTPQYDSNTHTDDKGLEVVVDLVRPTLVTPPPAYTRGFVREIRDARGSSVIPFDAVVLSAQGTARAALLAAAHLGDEIRISQEITHYHTNCETLFPEIGWTKTYASLSGGYTILENGDVIDYTDKGAVDKHPRTAIAYNDQFIYFIVVDGRQTSSIGMSLDQLAHFAHDTLGATWAVAQDGGGSSTMVINDKLMNQPVSICNMIFLPQIVRGNPAGVQTTPPKTDANTQQTLNLYTCERQVSNAVLMVQVEPGKRSTTFEPFDTISTRAEAQVRLGPGTNYGILTTLPTGSNGIVLAQIDNLDGVFATGAYWWKVAFTDGVVGWTTEENLSYVSTPPNGFLERRSGTN